MATKGAPVRVKDLMVRDVISVQPGDPLSEAVSLMFENRVSAVPVVDKRGRCKGMLSTTDLIGLFRKQVARGLEPDELDRFTEELVGTGPGSASLGGRKVSEVMTRGLMTVTQEDTILTAAREMLRSRVHRLVVVDPNQRCVGILSTMDLLEAFAARG
jgi:CBS domain-containing protein